MKMKLLLTVALSTFTFNSPALETLEERAVVQRMNADLLLPSGKTLNVDVSFDCGSDYHNTAIMVMSDAGAELLAAAYTHLYGEKFGQQVIDTWNTKKNTDDPRKPTYLFAIAPRNKSFAWKNDKVKKVHNKLTYDTLEEHVTDVNHVGNVISNNGTESNIPTLAAGCGTKIHDPQVAQ